MNYKELDEFVAKNGFDNKVDTEGKPMQQAIFETERINRNVKTI